MAHRVRIAESSQAFEAAADETVLAAALRANVNLAHDCQLGGCGTCRIRLLEGAVAYDELPLALTPEEDAAGYALACQARPRSDLVIRPARAVPEAPEAARHAAVVRAVMPASPLVTRLVLDIPDVERVDFLPGQHMNVIMPDGGARSFSMASKPGGNRVDFHIRRVERGAFTDRRLSCLKPGDVLEVDLPLGSFHFHAEDDRPLLLVATGTGLAPLKSMLDALMDDPDCPPVSFYWGTRTAADLYIRDEIEGWKSRLYEFNYVPVLSRADAAWPGRRGYVQDVVTADLPDLSEHSIYLCGSPEMIASAKPSFIARGASIERIYSEGFLLNNPVTSRSVDQDPE
ncbi:MAG: 2Fe-2S iron-sulfur cluster binding domain-containing protein [Xanthobacteraceae bacterium]|nr:2Fe-2S iron-sulfur cluster binding domain-containing protein [Xanthobacteraceae bacterium]